jgi:hypothetical protein
MFGLLQARKLVLANGLGQNYVQHAPMPISQAMASAQAKPL